MRTLSHAYAPSRALTRIHALARIHALTFVHSRCHFLLLQLVLYDCGFEDVKWQNVELNVRRAHKSLMELWTKAALGAQVYLLMAKGFEDVLLQPPPELQV